MPLLSEKRRKELREKAQKRASRQVQKATRQGERQISRIESGAARRSAGVRRSYARGVEQVGNVSLKGLGEYRGDVKQEIAATQAGLERVAPHHVAKVQARAQGRVRDIRSSLREAEQSATESNLSALVEAARGRVLDREEQAETVAERQRDREDENRLAMEQARFLLKLGPGDPKSVSKEAREAGHPITDEDWLMFTQALAGKEGVGLTTAKRIVNQLRRRQEPGLAMAQDWYRAQR